MFKADRDFWKTYPWLAIAAAVLFAGLFIRYLVTGRVKVLNSRFQEPYYIEYAERPTDYLIILALVGLLCLGSVGFTLFRLRRRQRYLEEDQASDAGQQN